MEDTIAYLSAVHCGNVVSLLDGFMHESLKKNLVRVYLPDYIFSDELDWEGYDALSPGIYKLRGEGSTKLHNKLQLMLSTSGTTGSPKLIRLSKENILSNSQAIIAYLNIDSSERAIASLPFHYSYGLSVLHSHLFAGASIVLTQSSVTQNAFWEIFKKFSCTSLAGVPYTYKALERVGFLTMNLPSLKTLTQAGGHLDPALVVKFYEKVNRFFVMYGQTEATARIAYLPPNLLPEKLGSIGIPIPGGSLKIYDGENQVKESKHTGEIVYRGSNVMLGYAQQASDLAKGDELNGTLRTGDLGYFDQDQIFFVTGRMKRISKVYGLRINLDDIEKELAPYGNIAVTATDEQITIYVENGSKAKPEECIEHLSQIYGLHPSTFRCLSIEKLPRTTSDKIDYMRLG